MPFREKTAWISLVTMLLVFGAYYGAIVAGRFGSGGMASVHFLVLSVLTVIVVQVVANIVARAMSQHDASSPKDERERLIELKATRIAFYALIGAISAVMLVTIHTPLLGPHVYPAQMGTWILGAVILSDIVKNAAQIVYFRRGV